MKMEKLLRTLLDNIGIMDLWLQQSLEIELYFLTWLNNA